MSLSPTRFVSARLANSEISDTQNMVKRMSLHTYHIRNKNGNPTAQVAIMKDADENQGNMVMIEEPQDTASVSQSTTKPPKTTKFWS